MPSVKPFGILVEGWGEGVPLRSDDPVIARDQVIGESQGLSYILGDQAAL